MTEPIWSWTAARIAGAVRRREVSAREVTEAHLARLDEVNPALNAVTARCDDEALAAADAVDSAMAAGLDSATLAGVPVTIKENHDVAGQATPNGVPGFADVVAPADAPLVTNLRRAGAVVIGRTNTPEFSYRWHTDNPLRGATINPWTAARTPGGSSGGAASSLAMGIGAIAHGNDLGGSIRYPAYCCGLIGLRPTQGRVPAFNHSAPAERPPVLQMMSVQGPLTRTVDDARLALDAMAAASSWDPHHVPAPTRLAARSGPPRAAIATGPVTPAAEVRAALDQAAAHLEAGGYEVTAHEPPELERMVELWTGLLFAEMRVSGLAQLRSMASPALNSIVDAYQTDVPDIDLGGFIELLSTRLTVLRRWTRLFETYDVVVMPVSAELAIAPAEDASSAQRCREILHAQTCLVAMNVLGLPSVAVPTGVAADRTPVGVQIVADRFREDRALDAAEAIERATGPLTERLWSPS